MWERNINWLPPVCAPTRDWTYNPSMCPEQGQNLQSFSAQDGAQTNWATWPGLSLHFKFRIGYHYQRPYFPLYEEMPFSFNKFLMPLICSFGLCGFSYPKSTMVWNDKYHMDNFRNKQLVSYKLLTILGSVMKCLANLWIIPLSSISTLYTFTTHYLAAILIIGSTVQLSQCLCSSNPYSWLMLCHNVAHLTASHHMGTVISSHHHRRRVSTVQYFERPNLHNSYYSILLYCYIVLWKTPRE